ncbi:MAG TPA: hydroxymethylbilane synthase [Candidatus Agrococcus pullicola]|uniref:Porphobilinogen deaminase n=1 Tax=Candidatus Agrococcus pullicola TaxID=2838429 RepID=A0A9D1YX69_9MICO|nr:hydroxymethylbilane synthase [Candidatus Agrococcus pullicola]
MTSSSPVGRLRVGTRGSLLALAQTRAIAERFDGDVEIVEITTKGDVDRTPLSQLGGTGVFVSALREALLSGEVDIAVHSMKDLPTAPAEGIALAAVPAREDPRDALVSRGGRTLDELQEGARVGTGSPRRKAQLLSARPDLDVVDIRGNITTRMDRAIGSEPDLDAVVLAVAGLQRAGFADRISEALDTERFPQAPAQGALAIETRADDEDAQRAVAVVEDEATRAAVGAERLVLAGLEAGCSAPVGASAGIVDGALTLTASVYALDGTRMLQAAATDSVAHQAVVADRVVRELLEAGAEELVK